MNCKYCNAELENGAIVCPECGTAVESLKKEKNAKQTKGLSKTTKIVLGAVGGVLAMGVLVCAVLLLLGFRFRPNDVEYKNKYTVSDRKAQQQANTVIAKVGDIELTNAEFQALYAMSVMDFLSENSGNLVALGLNYEKPLYEQTSYFKPDQTWEQFFVSVAMSSWHQTAALRIMGEAEGHTMNADLQQIVDGLEADWASIASERGFESADAVIKHDLGAGATFAGYLQYCKDYYYGISYFKEKMPSLEPTPEEIQTYYAENEKEMNEYGITKDSGKAYDVRHILIEVSKTTGEDGKEASTEADWEKCLADAQKLLKEWKDGEATEESFAALAKEHSADPGSAANGGLYSGLTSSTSFVQEFKDWYLDENRKVGDTGLVKSVYGYHIMYFSASEEIWVSNVKAYMMDERTFNMVQEAKERYPIDTTYRKIILGEMTF